MVLYLFHQFLTFVLIAQIVFSKRLQRVSLRLHLPMLLGYDVDLEDLGSSSNMSPCPTSLSAPPWSRMTLLSVRLETAKAILAGMFALITPVMTLVEGRCVATTKWIPTALAF